MNENNSLERLVVLIGLFVLMGLAILPEILIIVILLKLIGGI